jgi:hypothetical protein
MPIEKLNRCFNCLGGNDIYDVNSIGDKLNEVIEIVNKISSLERLEKDLKELGEAFDNVE